MPARRTPALKRSIVPVTAILLILVSGTGGVALLAEPLASPERSWWSRIGLLGIVLLTAVGVSVLAYRAVARRLHARERELERRLEEGLAELSRSEKRYRQLFERNLAGVVRATVDGRVLDCNDAFARIFGYDTREECRWRHRVDFGLEPEALLERLQGSGSLEARAWRRDGSEVTLLWSANLVMDETGEAVVIEGTVIDISERQRTEERRQRERRFESLAILAGGIAHDFNNLLVGILGHVELARLELPHTSPMHEHLRGIEQSAQRAAALSTKMLAYSGKGRFLTQPVDLVHTVRELTSEIESAVGDNVRIEFDLAPSLPPVEADRSQLTQLLVNLAANGSEAIGDSKEGRMEIFTDLRHYDRPELARTVLGDDLDAGDYIVLEVRDNGCGMDAETQGKIFDPFFTTKFPGRGLGLSVVMGIVRGHGGALKVESEPGHGTTVQVLFPVAERVMPDQAEAEPHDTTWRGSGKVLLVDDERVVRVIGQRMLEILGFEVMTAADGREGVELFRRHADDLVLVLLDLTMPRMNGADALAEIRDLRPGARVLLASGYDERETAKRFAGKGLAGFMHKPFRLDILREKVRAALEAEM